MSVIAVDELYAQVGQVRENPNIPHEKGKDLGLDDLRQTMSQTRAALTAAIEGASDNAFTAQPENSNGEEVWSVGEIVGHCNGALIGIGKSALDLAGVDAGEPPEDLKAASEPQIITRDEALTAASAFDADEFFSMFPDTGNLDNTGEHNFFGTMSARSWLYFMALHESDHVYQIRSLG